MATIKKRGKVWFVQVRRKGITRCSSHHTKYEAQAWAVKTEAEILSGNIINPSTDHHSLRDALQRYADEVSCKRRGERWERIRLGRFCRDPLADTDLLDVTPDMLGKWRDDRLKEVQAGTVLREITLLSAVFEIARKEWRWVSSNPWKDVRKPSKPRHRERLVDPREAERIVLHLGYTDDSIIITHKQQTAVAFLFAIETAMRCGEITSLKWRDVDLDRRVATLRITKNGDSRQVPLSARAVDLLRKLKGVDLERCFTVSEGVCSVLFYRAKTELGIEDLHFHDSRAEALTRLSKKLEVLELARMVGHRDVRSLMFYYRESAEELAKKL